MMFRRKVISTGLSLALGIAPALVAFAAQAAGVALVPERTIYPGETITPSMVRTVDVINPNLAGGYASEIGEIDGMVTTRTLLPGRTIPVATLREAWAVERGSAVTLVFADGGLVITAPGTPLENGSIGDLVRARNTDSGVVISGTVMQDGSIRVVRK